MYSNPLIRKHKTGGDISTSEMEDIMQAFYQWLPTAIKDFQGMEPAQVEEAVKGMMKTAKGQKQVEDLLQRFQQVMVSADQKSTNQESTGMFKQGGKLHDFICKHAVGGRVKAGCGCHENGGEIESAEKGTKTKNNYTLGGLNFVERYYDPSGNAVYTLAQSRETLPSNMRSNPYSEYSQNGGEYQGDGQVSVVDFGNGRTAINMDPYGVTPGDTFAHGVDSIAVLNRLRQIAPKAGIILGPAIREDGGIISAQDGTYLTRGDAFRAAMERGLTRDDARHAYWGSKNQLRAKGLRGRELRQGARQMIAGQYPMQRNSIGLEPVTNLDNPNEINGITGRANIAVQNLVANANENAKSALDSQMAARYGNGIQQRVQNNWNNQSFDTAFGNARKLGQKTFSWRDRLFGTRLASTPEEKDAWAKSRGIKLAPQTIDQNQITTPATETPTTEQPTQERQYTSSRELPLESQILGLPYDGVYPIMDDYRSNWVLGTRSANTDNNVDNSTNNQNSRNTFVGSYPEDSWGTRELERNYQKIAEEQGIPQAQQYARENGYKGAGAAIGSAALGIGLASTLGTAATSTSAASTPLLTNASSSTPLLTYSGKTAYQAPRMGWQLWRGADGQWIGNVGGQLFRNGSLYFPLATMKCGGKVKKGEDGMVSEKKTPDTGKITQGKARSKFSQAIDNNPKARHFYEGVVKFTESPMVRWPLAGTMGRLGWKFGGLGELGKFGSIAGTYLSQLNPVFLVKSTLDPELKNNAKVSDVIYALPK